MNILFYTQISQRSIFFESVIEGFIKRGHKVHFVTNVPAGRLHEEVKSLGAEVTVHGAATNFFLYRYLALALRLWIFCRRRKIDLIFSHLQTANIIALISGKALGKPVVPCRHHIDASYIAGNWKARLEDRIVNFLANSQVVVSEHARRFIIDREGGNPDHVHCIPLGYNFSRYPKPNADAVAKIKSEAPARLRLVMISRLIATKRHIVALRVLDKMVTEGKDVSLFILDNGPEKDNLSRFVKEHSLQKCVHFCGFVENVANYFTAADLILLPSIQESSNQVVKEAGYEGKTAMICTGIGDYDDYLEHRKHVFFASVDNTEKELLAILNEVYEDKSILDEMGQNLKLIVEDRFAIDNVVEQYLQLAART